MNRIRIIVLSACLVLFAVPQEAGATSLFSMNLVGERLESGDVRAISLGGSAQLLQDSLGVMQLNPALLAGLTRVTVGATQFLAFDEGRSSEFTERDVSVAFSAFRLAFPIRDYLTFSVGYSGRYDADGSFSVPGESVSGDSYTWTRFYSGGLFSVPLTVSASVSKYLAVGLTFSLERGFIEDRWDIVFDDPLLVPGAGLKKEEFSGHGFGGGVVVTPLPSLMLGGTMESAIDYDSEVRTRFTQSGLDTTYETSLTLPARYSVAVTWQASESFILLGSASWSDFKEFEGLAFPADRLTSEQSYSFGVEYLKGFRLRSKRFPLRASFSYQTLPYEQPLGMQVHKVLFGLGTAISIGDGKGKLDLGLQAGKVGAMNDNEVEDRILRLYVGVSGSELWKRKRVRRY